MGLLSNPRLLLLTTFFFFIFVSLISARETEIENEKKESDKSGKDLGRRGMAWKLCDPEAEKVFKAIKEAGVKVAIVSNFDTQLRPLLRALRCEDWFDVVAVSAEVKAEKPNPTIFLKACELLGVNLEDAVHVGDDRRNDVWGARDAGCDAWLWGSEVTSFKQVKIEFLCFPQISQEIVT